MIKSASITFADVLDAARVNAPELIATEVRQQQAKAYQGVGEGWFSGRPSWEFSYIDDGVLNDIGLREMETGVQVNLWRPGERSDAVRLGDTYNNQLEAWKIYLNLSAAGKVRQVLADIDAAEAMLDLERQSTTDAAQLLEITTSLNAAGSVPELDVLQAQTLLLQQQRQELNAEALLVDVEAEYSVLTGLTIRPLAPLLEIQADLMEIQSDHPLLQYLQSIVDVAEARVSNVKRQVSGNPTMSLGVRRERGDRLQPYFDSLGISVSVPFGKSAVATASVSDARSGKVDAEVRLLSARRDLDRNLHEVRHELELTAETLGISESQVELSGRRYQMARLAFEAGETDLTQVVVALQQARDSEKEYERLKLRQQQLVSEFNQVIGVLP